MKLIVNEKEMGHPNDDRLDTIENLLYWFETQVLEPNQVISKFNLAGTEIVDLCDPKILELPLATISFIKITVEKTDAILHGALSELSHQMDEVIHSIPQIVGYFENHDKKAYPALAEFLETLGTFAEIVSEDIGWSEPIENFPELERAVTQLIAARENNKWGIICATLAYKIRPILENWRNVVEKTITSLPTPTV